jgi:hypothetical protein
MKIALRLVKNRSSGRKVTERGGREQRFRYPANEVWEVSCGPARERPMRKQERRAS